MDYDFERENFLGWYKIATVKDMALAMRTNPEKLTELLCKYAHAINLINLVYRRAEKMSDVNVMEPTCVETEIEPVFKSLNAKIQKHIECKITAFNVAIAETGELEIDGVSLDGRACEEIAMDSRIKVLNHQTKDAYEVEIDTIVRTPLKDIILALKTGDMIRLHGVTRIVGYYSRIHNWNKSKIGELHDRHKGNYAVNK